MRRVDIVPVALRYYQTSSRRVPFREWLNSLDTRVRWVLDARLTRLERGLFGDAKPVGMGVFELRMDAGPGYRVYFGRHARVAVILLVGGTKKSQETDIETAQAFWKDYLGRKRG